ncbi:phosphoenolpyruvate carboxylase, partial [Candidatus Pelagibacter sp.]|nr:phosphoenolpyruvate carboxylase [Candidatus Pelagibacter sp.]
MKKAKDLLNFWEEQMRHSHTSSNYFFRKSPSHYHMMLLVMSAYKSNEKLSASWHQYKLQEEILIIAKKYKIELTFFHGRGGSHGRGGGPIQATMRSQPPNSVYGRIRITDQGEMIQQKYGYEPLA